MKFVSYKDNAVRSIMAGMRRVLMPALLLALMAGAFLPIGAEADSSVSLSAKRSGDGTTAKVSWSSYGSRDFEYYRFVVCPSAHFIGGTCSNNVFVSDAYFDASFTGPVTATGLDRYTSYGVILQVWRTGGEPMLRFYDTISALSQPTPKPPATPSSVSVSRADGTLAASWPAVDGATSYHVTYSSDGERSWSLAALNHSGTSIAISVDNAKTYVVGVRARNSGGDSGWRNSPAAGPFAPPKTTPTPEPGCQQQAPRDGFASITIVSKECSQLSPTPEPTPGQTPDPTATPTPKPVKPPAKPSSVSVSRTNSVLTASWPAVDGATSYHVTYSSDGKRSWSLADLNHPDASITIRGVDNDETYVVGVRARNSAGDSGWRNSPAAWPWTPPETTPTPAPAPSVTATRGADATTATVSWTKYTGGDFGYYRFVVCPDASFIGGTCSNNVFTSDAYYNADSTGPVTVTGLDAQTGYGVILQVWRRGQGSALKPNTTIPAATQATSLSFGAATVDDQSYVVDAEIETLTLPAASRDSDGASATVGAVTYSLSPELPAGLSFDALARTVSGTPTATSTGASYTYTAAYGEETATLSFDIEVTEAPGFSFGGAAVADQSWIKDLPIATLTLPAATGGNGTTTYSLSPSLPDGLSFDASARTISGTPTATTTKATYYYTATDGTDTAALSFGVEVTEGLVSAQGAKIQAGLSWVTTPTDQKWQQGTAVNVQLPAATGADHIVYSLVNSGQSNRLDLPPGLSWNGSTRTISGTPTGDFSAKVFVYNAAATNKGTHANLIFMVADTTGNYPPYANIKSNKAQLLAQLWSHYGPNCYSGNITFAPSSGHNVHFVDPDGDTMTFTAGSTDMVRTTINSSGYAVTTLRHPPLKGNWYYLHYTATDPGGLDDSIQLGIQTFECTDTMNITENKPKGTVVGTLGGGNASEGNSFSLSGDAATHFAIDSTTGQITASSTLDYETKTSYSGSFQYRVTNAGNAWAGGSIRINVRDIRAPNVDRPTLAQNSTNPTTALDVSWTAPTPMTGTTLVDYDVRYREWTTSTWTEMPDTTNSTTTSTTITGLTAGKEYEVQVRSEIADEGPGHWSGSSLILYLAENTAVSGNVGGKFNVNATDYYPLSFTLGGTDGSKFKLSTDTGYKTAQWAQIQVKAGNVPNYESKSSYSLTLRAVENNLQRNILDITYSVLIIVTDVNEAPELPATATRTIAENSAVGTNVGAAVTATDEDGVAKYNTLAYSLSGTDAGKFDIGTTTGQIAAKSAFNYEAKSSYSVTVNVTDGKDASGATDTAIDDTVAVTINVTDANEAPSFASATTTLSIAENSAAGTNVGAAVTATDPDTVAKFNTLAYTLSGTDAGNFDIGSSSGQITVKSGKVPDYEAKTSHSVTVHVTDGKNGSGTADTSADDTIAVTITVTDVAEPPAAPTLTVAPHSTTPTTKISASWTAPTMTGKPALSGYDVQYKLADDSSWTTHTFTGTGTATTLAGLTAGKSYDVRVRAKNDEGDSGWATGRAVTDGAAVTRSVAENSPAGTNVGAAVTATSTNTSYSYTHALGGTDAGKFEIGSGTGQITVKSGTSLDYETKNSYSVTVTVTAAAAGVQSQSLDPNAPGDYVVPVTINVTDVNETPTIDDGATTTRSVSENSAAGSNVGAAVTATDPDGDTLYYSLTGADASKFAVGQTTGQITVGNGTTLDYESGTTSYSVTVNVTDREAEDGTADTAIDDTVAVTINVTDVAEPPAAPAAPTVAKNAGAPRTKLDVSWTAPTMTGKPAIDDYDVQYRKHGDSTWSSHSFSGTGTATTIASLTAGKSYEVQVRAVNAEGDGAWSDSGTAITDGGGVTRSVAENSAAGANVGAAVTATANPNSYTLTHTMSGTDAGKFTIESGTGQIKVKSGTALNYESGNISYSVVVTVKAAAAGANAQSLDPNAPGDYVVPVTINVTDVDEPPPAPDTPSVWQHSPSPKTELDVSWTAPDVTGKPAITDYDVRYKKSATSTWSAWTHNGTSTTARLTGLTEGTRYEVQVRAVNDEGEGAWSVSGNAETQDKNVHSDFPAATTTRSIAENSAAGTNVGAPITGTDTEGHTLYYTLTGTDGGKFDVGLNTGQVKVKTGHVPNYEAKTSYSVVVQVSDRKDTDDNPDTVIDDTIEVTVYVTDVAEPPVKPAAPSVSANTATPASKLDVSWTAPDMTGKPAISDYDVQYRLSGGSSWTDLGFTGTGTTTGITGLTAGKSYDVQVRATNAEGTGDWSNSGVAITTAGGVTREIAENSPAGTNVGAAVTATSTAYTYSHSLSGTDAGSFTIESATGQVKVKSGTVLDYESNKTSYSVVVTVRAASAGAQAQGASVDPNAPGDYVVPVTINVTDVSETPEFPSDTAARSVAENSAAGTNVGAVVTATDQDGDTLEYSLAGTDADEFEIGSGTGQITVKSGHVPDYEAKSSYSVTVQVTDNEDDSGNPDTAIDDTIAVTINVTDVAEPPAAPDGPTMKQNADSPSSALDVRWDAPDMTGKPAITDYDVRYRKTGTSTIAWTSHSFTGTAASTTIAGLAKGTRYEVQVKAINDEGESGWSTSGSTRTLAIEKASVQVPENATGGTAVSGSLPAVDSDGHAVAYAITSDEVVGGGASASSQGGTQHGEFTINSTTGQILVRQGANLNYEQSHSHVITVTASHADRNDPDHDMINAVITVTIAINDVAEPPAAPDAPDLFQGSDRYRTLDVSWTAPDMTGKPAITDYDVEYRLAGGSWVDLSFDGTETSDTITGLTPGVEYEARVRASNAEGTGLWSDPGAGFTKVLPSADDITNPPGQPDAPSVSPAGSSPQTALSVTWTAPADNGSAITGYNIRYRVDGAKSWSSGSSTVTGTVIGGLTEETTYEAQVQAINGMGKSAWSASGRGSTTAYPAATVVDEYQAAPVQQQGPVESRPSSPSNGDAKLKTKTALTFRVAENSPADTSVGTPVEATDADGDALTWSISGADEFTIDAATGQIMVASGAALDYETKNSYAVTVGVSDGLDADGNADASVDDTTEVTILVTDVAEPPARPDAPSVSANAASPTSALTVGWSAPGNGGGPAITGYDLRYRAKGSSSWTSDSSTVTGAVITGLASDTTYEVQVRAVNDEGVSEWSASGEGATEEGATEKANAAPTFPSGVARQVSENSAAGTLVGDPVTATDADGDALSYSLSGASEFAIDAGTGQISVAAGAVLDYETKSSYAVTVSASDGSADATVAVTIRVTDVDESAAVAFTSGSVTRQVSENSAVGTLVGDPVTADGDALSYTLSGASEFAIDVDTGQISVASGAVLDYESVSSYGVTVRASDGSSDSAAISVTIGVTDVDEPPSRPDAPSVSAAADTPTSALNVGWDAPSNGDGPAITGYDLRYRAQGDTDWQSDSSTATGAVITGLASGTTYEVQVRAINDEGKSEWSESGDGATEKPNAAPTFPSGASREIAENSAAGTAVGDPVAAVDADGDALSYTLSGASEFVIDAETGQISVATGAVLDHETIHSYGVTVSVSDGVNAAVSAKVTIRVTDVDEPPSRPDAPSVSAAADTPTSELTVSWSAPANGGGPAITGYDLRYRAEGTVSWTYHPVVGTATSAAIAGLESDTTYEAQVRAINDEGASEWSESGAGATAKPNAAPTFPSGASREIAENSAAGTSVGQPVTASDADGDALSYTLSGASEFAIDADTGQISVAAGASLDYETKSSYVVTVSVSDGLGADGNADAAVDATVEVTIGVTDVDESVAEPNGPPSVTAPADKEYRQGETIASFAIAVSDPDGDAVEVSLSGLPGGLSYSGGKVSGTVSSDATAATYTVTITASDGVNAAVTAEFDIEVSEPGVLVLLADLSLVSWLWLLLALLLTVLWIVYRRRRRLKHNPV